MDVKRGQCWRCQKSTPDPDQTHVCKKCEIAIYCTEKCRGEDQYRHKPECEVWGPKKCNNPGCSKTGRLKEYSGCNDAWYCGETCQLQDRGNHKKLCQKRIKSIKTAAIKKREYFQERSGGPFCRPYYIGNTLAVDMLNLQDNECHEDLDSTQRMSNLQDNFAVLSAGCGNLRNTILTTASLPDDFAGKLHVALNDYDPFAQARNVLFLYMMTAHASLPDLAMILTTVWYSLHLPDKDFKFVTYCLRSLVGMTGSALKSTTNGLIDVAEDCMPQIREVWRGWIDVCLHCHKGSTSYIDLQAQRQMLTSVDEQTVKWKTLIQKQVSRECADSVELWLHNGNFLATIASNKQILEYDNPTLSGYHFVMTRPNTKFHTLEEAQHLMRSPRHHPFVYCIPPNLSAFSEWDQLLVEKHSSSKSLIVMFHTYVTSLIDKTIAFLKERRLSVAVHVCNGLEMPSRVKTTQKFDRILSSNIADYLGTQTILKAFKPLLKTTNKYAVVITQYINWSTNSGFSEAEIESNFEAAVDGTYKECLLAAKQDTGREGIDDMMKFGGAMTGNSQFMFVNQPGCSDPQSLVDTMSKMGLDEHLVQEYFNNTIYFICLLRADLMACDKSLPADKAVSFQKVLHMEGFQMRDFRRERNKVIPFTFRRNARPINLLRGLERMVEWYITEQSN